MKFKHIDTNNNCEMIHEIIFDKEYSVVGFIKEILEKDEYKEGRITVYSKDYMLFWPSFDLCGIWYEDNRIVEIKIDKGTSDRLNLINEKMLQRVSKAYALESYNGRWNFHVEVGHERK